MANCIPPRGAADLVEWGSFPTAEPLFAVILPREVPIDRIVAVTINAPALASGQQTR
jgi:hypothetical protein